MVDAHFFAGAVGYVVVAIGFSLGGPSGDSRSCQPFLRVLLHEAVREPRWSGVVRPISYSTAPVGGSWHYPACTKS